MDLIYQFEGVYHANLGWINKKQKKSKHINDVLNDKQLLSGVMGAMVLEMIPDTEAQEYKIDIKANDISYVPFDYKFFGDDEKDSFMSWWSKTAYVNQRGGIEAERLKRYRDYHFMNANSTEIMLAVETYRDEALATSIKAEDLIKIGVFTKDDEPIKDLSELAHKEFLSTFADYHSDMLEGLIVYGDHFVPLFYKTCGIYPRIHTDPAEFRRINFEGTDVARLFKLKNNKVKHSLRN